MSGTYLAAQLTSMWRTLTTKIWSSESSASLISVCAEHHQQLIAPRNKRGRLLPATPASQQGVCLAVTVEYRHRVIVALAWQTVALFQVHDGEVKFDAVSRSQTDAPVAVDVIWIDAWKVWAAEVATYSQKHLLTFTCVECSARFRVVSSHFWKECLPSTADETLHSLKTLSLLWMWSFFLSEYSSTAVLWQKYIYWYLMHNVPLVKSQIFLTSIWPETKRDNEDYELNIYIYFFYQQIALAVCNYCFNTIKSNSSNTWKHLCCWVL